MFCGGIISSLSGLPVGEHSADLQFLLFFAVVFFFFDSGDIGQYSI